MEELKVTEYRGMRVLTTQQIAEAYGVEAKKITDNFNNNKSRYVEGKHFICLDGEELKRFKSETENLGFARNLNKLYLWTKKGAFLHAKSLNTDTAWEVYDRLVDSYFDHSNLLEGMSPELKAALIVDKRVTKVEHRIDHIENDMPLFGAESDELSAHIRRRGAELLGGKKTEAYLDNAIRQRVYRDIYNQLRREFGIYDDEGKMKSYKALKRRISRMHMNLLTAIRFRRTWWIRSMIVMHRCGWVVRMEYKFTIPELTAGQAKMTLKDLLKDLETG